MHQLTLAPSSSRSTTRSTTPLSRFALGLALIAALAQVSGCNEDTGAERDDPVGQQTGTDSAVPPDAGLDLTVSPANDGLGATSSGDATSHPHRNPDVARTSPDAAPLQPEPDAAVVVWDPPADADEDFEQRCNAPGVILCDPLDNGTVTGRYVSADAPCRTGLPDPVECKQGYWRFMNADRYTGNRPSLDTTMKYSGSGAMKYTIPSNTAETSGSGWYGINFSSTIDKYVGPEASHIANSVYVQYRVRWSRSLLFDGTQRRRFRHRQGGFTTWKQTWLEAGDHPTYCRTVHSDGWCQRPMYGCSWLEVLQNHGQPHAISGYHACGWYEAFHEGLGLSAKGNGTFDLQPGGETSCLNVDSAGSLYRYPNKDPGCVEYPADEWVTLQVGLEIGAWQPDRKGAKQSKIKVWLTDGSGNTVRVMDHAFFNRGPEPALPRDIGYGRVLLYPFMTKKDPTEAHPTGYMWIDELIISTRRIPDPSL